MKIEPVTVSLKNGQIATLRSPSPRDAAKILEHLVITHTESFKNLNQPSSHWAGFLIADEEKILADFENSVSKFMIVAEIAQEIKGILGCWSFQAEFVKHSASFGMNIQSDSSGIGLGSEMVRALLQNAPKIGVCRIELNVRAHNLAGIKLYEKFGFEIVGLLKHAAFIEGQYYDEFSYQKILGV